MERRRSLPPLTPAGKNRGPVNISPQWKGQVTSRVIKAEEVLQSINLRQYSKSFEQVKPSQLASIRVSHLPRLGVMRFDHQQRYASA